MWYESFYNGQEKLLFEIQESVSFSKLLGVLKLSIACDRIAFIIDGQKKLLSTL